MRSGEGLECLMLAYQTPLTLSMHQVAQLIDRSKMESFISKVTGVLLVVDRQFVHYLEGSKAAVEMMRTEIRQSDEYVDVVELMGNPVSKRQFSDWHWAVQMHGGKPHYSSPIVSGYLADLTHRPQESAQSTEMDVLTRFWPSI
jgi:hypothetical protein